MGDPRRGLLALAAAIALFILQCVPPLSRNSGTCDELGAHIPSGILAWKSGIFSGGVANPPLGQLLVGAGPVLCGKANHPLADSPQDLFPARLPVVFLGAAVIAWVGILARRCGNSVTAAVALFTASVCPDLLAHSTVATLDVPSLAWGLAAMASAWAYLDRPRPVILLVYALSLGAAASTKWTTLHLIPAVSLGVLVAAPGPLGKRWRQGALLGAAGCIGVIAVSGILSLGFPSPPSELSSWERLLVKWEHGRTGHFSFLQGARSGSGFPHYFVVALLVKAPISMLTLACLGVWAWSKSRRSEVMRRFTACVLFPAVWIFAALSLVHRVHIGIRHILLVYPALFILAGCGGAFLAERGRAGRSILAALAILGVSEALIALPDPLSFFNFIAGGPHGGSRVLIDSNLDWGQDEQALRSAIAGRSVSVNPLTPQEGIVAANVNAVRGILQPTDDRLGWTEIFPVEERVGRTWILVDANEKAALAAAQESPFKALRAAQWLAGTGRGRLALETLQRNDLSHHPGSAGAWRRAVAEAHLALGQYDLAARLIGPEFDPDLATVLLVLREESLGIPWDERDARSRIRMAPAFLARGQAKVAFEIAHRALETSPQEGQAWRALLLSGLALEVGPTGTTGGRPLLTSISLPNVAPLTVLTGPTTSLSPVDRLMRAQLLKEARCEAASLEEVGELLAVDPANAEAMNLYGELVVRRKLGLTEYPWPRVDWSGLARR